MPDFDELQAHNSPAALTLGREIVSIDTETGAFTLKYFARPEFANRHGTMQGGFLAAMLDSATGMALMATLPSDMTAVTTRLDVSFLKPASLGSLNALSRVVRRDERSADVEAEITNTNGDVLASAKATLRILKRH